MAKYTHHALLRWKERFPDRDIDEEYGRAVYRLTTAERKHIKAQCSLPENKAHCDRGNTGRVLRKTTDGIVFVLTLDEVVITVLKTKNYQPERR